MPTPPEPTAEVIEQAATWAAQLAANDASDAELAAYEAWCQQHPSHRLAMERMFAFHAPFAESGPVERQALDVLLRKRIKRRLRAGSSIVGVLLLGCLGWLAAHSWTVNALFPDEYTARGEQRSIPLRDGAIVLDTDTAVDVGKGSAATHISLFKGRVLASVTPNRPQPFVIETDHGTASALGTSFVVEHHERSTLVTVIESRVRACARGPHCLDLAPGERARIAEGHVGRLANTDPEDAGTWATGWLVADDRPLVEVLSEFNRYRIQPIRFMPATLTDIRVSGSFALKNTDNAVQRIAGVLRLRVSRSPTGELTISR